MEDDDQVIDTELDIEQGDDELDPPEPDNDDEGGEDEFSIEIDGEEAQEEPPLVKQLRNEIREAHRELSSYRKAQQPQIVVGEKPTLEGCDWDEDKFEAELTAYHDRKRRAEAQESEAGERAAAVNQQFERARARYQASAMAKKLNLEEAEKKVADKLGAEMLGMMVMYSSAPENIVAALGKYPAKLDQIAEEPDPVRKIRLIWELESKVTVNRKKPPNPESETIQRGSAPISGQRDKTLERLEKEAERNGGDRSKIAAYKRSLRTAA